MGKIKLVIIGAGFRGTYTYGKFIEENKDLCEVVAVVEGKKGRREYFKKRFNLPENKVFENIESFFEEDKMADAVIVCNYDSLHFTTSNLALQKGYNVLLEGPISNSLDEIIHLEELCKNNKDKIFMSCMTYRYSNFFNKLKEIIDNKSLGYLININYNSNIGYEKFVHNYVRGNWRINSDSATLLLTNSCYDLDILSYLISSSCEKISSFGSLNHFKKENFTGDMSHICIRCGETKDCPFCAQNIYLDENKEISKVVHINPTRENIEGILKDSPYGKCVYYCDNDVYDNIVSILKYKNNVTATLNITAFTKEEDIDIRLLFTYGEIRASFKDKTIKIKRFINKNEEVIKVNEDDIDNKLIKDFIKNIKSNNTNIKSSVKSSLESHITAFAGELANISDTVINVKSFYEDSVKMTSDMEKILFK